MKIMYKVLILMLISVSVFAKPLSSKYDKQIEAERKSVASGVERLKKEERVGKIFLTGVSNELFLEQAGGINQKLNLAAIDFIFPDLRYVDKYIEQVSKNIPLVYIYLLDEKSDEEGLEYRDLPTLYELNLKEKLKKLGNIIVISINVTDEDKKKIIPNSFSGMGIEDEILKKYIFMNK